MRFNYLLIMLGMIMLGMILFSVSFVSASGKVDVLTDIRGIESYYQTQQCLDITNISYGSLEGCKANSSVTYTNNVNSVILFLAFLGNLDNNLTLINNTRDVLLSMAYLQNDDGSFAVDSGYLQDGTSAEVQSNGLSARLGESYWRIRDNLTGIQRDVLDRMIVKSLSYSLITPITIKNDTGSSNGGTRITDQNMRKQLNVSYDINNADDIRVELRITQGGVPVRSNLTIYLGQVASYNYTYDSRRMNLGIEELIQIPINKTDLLNKCADSGVNYICNITLVRNTIWVNPNSYYLVRTINVSSQNYSWQSTGGITWDTYNQEFWIRLNYYSNRTLDKIKKNNVANQYSFQELNCLYAYLILNESGNYPISTEIAKRCVNYGVNDILQSSKDGVYCEWNELLRHSTGNYNNSNPDYCGFSNHYQWLSSWNMAQIYNITKNDTYLQYLNGTINNLSAFLYSDNLTIAGGLGTRTETNSTKWSTLSNLWRNYPFLAFYSFMSQFNQEAQNYANLIISYELFSPIYTHGDKENLIYLYENFPVVGSSTEKKTDSLRYFYNLDNIGLVSIGTANYRVFLGYKNNSPMNTISSITRRNGDIYYQGDSDNSHIVGLACLNGGANSSCYDSRGIITLKGTYPYEVNFIGNLTNLNQSIVSSKTYNLTYYFGDDYFGFRQSNNAGLSLDYPLSSLTSALLINSSGSLCNGSSSNLALNTGQVNITLNPSDDCYVYDSYVLTEGRPLTGEPFTITSSGTTKHITSILDTSTNVPVILTYDRDCNTVNKVIYNSQVYNGEQATNFCNSLRSGTTLTINEGSNELTFEEGTSSMSRNVLRLTIGFIALFITICSVAMIYSYIQTNGMPSDHRQIITWFIILMFLVILGAALISYIYGVM